MNAPHDEDWNALDALWRSQAPAPPELDRLQRDARARGWRLRAVTALEWVALLATGAVCWRFLASRPGWQAFDSAVLVLCALAALFTGWTTYNRRGLAHTRELAPRALVQREIRRAEASLRFWRVNSWVTALLFTALAGATAAQFAGLIEAPGRASWITVMLINLPLVIASLLAHRYRSRTLSARRTRLQALAEQLDA